MTITSRDVLCIRSFAERPDCRCPEHPISHEAASQPRLNDSWALVEWRRRCTMEVSHGKALIYELADQPLQASHGSNSHAFQQPASVWPSVNQPVSFVWLPSLPQTSLQTFPSTNFRQGHVCEQGACQGTAHRAGHPPACSRLLCERPPFRMVWLSSESARAPSHNCSQTQRTALGNGACWGRG